MHNDTKDLFKGHQYISLDTYRKSGEAVRTPVWFAQEEDRLYVWTQGSSGKAKRIRRCPQVKIAPSDQRGNPLGPYITGDAQVSPLSTPTYEHGNQLINRKYGFLKKVFEFMGRKNAAERVIIEVKLQK